MCMGPTKKKIEGSGRIPSIVDAKESGSTSEVNVILGSEKQEPNRIMKTYQKIKNYKHSESVSTRSKQ